MPSVSPRLTRRVLTALAVVLGLTGAALIAYPFATDLWAARLQSGLEGDFASGALDYRRGDIKTGDALTRLEIPRLGVDVLVVEGTTPAALRAGAGHYADTPLPGEPGNVAVAGHRTTYGRAFNRMDDLVPGDKVVLTTPLGRHVYEILARPQVVDPNDWSVIRDYPNQGSFLTLTSCHPEGSAAYRIVVRGELVRSTDAVADRDAA